MMFLIQIISKMYAMSKKVYNVLSRVVIYFDIKRIS